MKSKTFLHKKIVIFYKKLVEWCYGVKNSIVLSHMAMFVWQSWYCNARLQQAQLVLALNAL